MSVLATCLNQKNPPTFASLDHLLAASDVVSLHCLLTPQTQKIINTKTLAKMRRGAIFLYIPQEFVILFSYEDR